MMPGPRKKLPPLLHFLLHSQTQTGQGSVGFLDCRQVALEAQTPSEANLALPEEASGRWAQAFPASSSPALFPYSSVPTLQGTCQAGLSLPSPLLSPRFLRTKYRGEDVADCTRWQGQQRCHRKSASHRRRRDKLVNTRSATKGLRQL